MNERLRFNTTQAAEYANRHRETVLKALAAGELHGTQPLDAATGRPRRQGRWSIRRECLDAWLDGERCAHRAAGAA